MNKLEEYKDGLASINKAPIEYDGNEASCWASGVGAGFDAVIALDLPVKFAIWCTKAMPEKAKNIVREHYPNYHKQLYAYWLREIYKPV